MLTPQKRTMMALRGEIPDKAPFTIYEQKLPRCFLERELRNRGICLVKRTASFKRITPNVKHSEYHYTDESGRNLVRYEMHTPHGTLSSVHEPAGFTSWRDEHFFKSPDDYKAILFWIKDTLVEENYAAARRLADDLGEDFVVRDNIGLEPLQTLISGGIMSMEDFAIEWMDNRDEILKLYDATAELARKIYPIIADGPLEFANYGGNVVPEMIGPAQFKEYYLPHYAEAAEALHKKGKLLGCHLDANNTPIMDAVAESALDYIEAYDPGMSPSVKVAREKWPGKTLWLNWPSAWHLCNTEEVKERTVDLIEEAGSLGGFIIGITEDVPEDRWRGNFTAIMDGIDEAAQRRK